MKLALYILKGILVLSIVTGMSIGTSAQVLTSHNPEIGTAREKLEPAFRDFGTCIISGDLTKCVDDLVKKAPDNYSQYNVAGLLFKADTAASFRLHQQAYQSLPDDEDFLLQYAIELHRGRQYERAAPLYEKYIDKHPGQISLYVWLSDCYMNLDKVAKAAELWTKADQPKNQANVDAAINTIYGKVHNMRQRNIWRADLAKGNKDIAPSLIYLDTHWDIDPTKKIIEEDFLTADMELLWQKMDTTSATYKQLRAYVTIKKLVQLQAKQSKDSVKKILIANNLLIDGKAIPAHGSIAAELANIATTLGIIDPKVFFNTRGAEILKLTKSGKDGDMLELYTQLQSGTIGVAEQSIYKMGWKDLKEERFAASYFIGKGEDNKYNDPELAQAMTDFPGSPMLYWVKINCARIEGKPMHELFIELIKREFKTVGSDPNHSSASLNAYFGFMATQK